MATWINLAVLCGTKASFPAVTRDRPRFPLLLKLFPPPTTTSPSVHPKYLGTHCSAFYVIPRDQKPPLFQPLLPFSLSLTLSTPPPLHPIPTKAIAKRTLVTRALSRTDSTLRAQTTCHALFVFFSTHLSSDGQNNI